ncbi:MAG: hypothetical protein NUV60_03385 [Patescibacteria group bacterium]|nr:hypothetical protein [Patescibacteria group bacterium]
MNTEELGEFVKTPACLAKMEEMFFKAMGPDYTDYSDIAGMPRTYFAEGPWTVEGGSILTPLGPRGIGMLLMAHEDVPIWTLQCFGHCQEEALPCLKAALSAAHAEKKFFGGRGQDGFVHEGLVYHNDVEPAFRTDFQGSNFFRGYEKIQRKGQGLSGAPGEVLGWHSYQGGMMIPAV